MHDLIESIKSSFDFMHEQLADMSQRYTEILEKLAETELEIKLLQEENETMRREMDKLFTLSVCKNMTDFLSKTLDCLKESICVLSHIEEFREVPNGDREDFWQIIKEHRRALLQTHLEALSLKILVNSKMSTQNVHLTELETLPAIEVADGKSSKGNDINLAQDIHLPRSDSSEDLVSFVSSIFSSFGHSKAYDEMTLATQPTVSDEDVWSSED